MNIDLRFKVSVLDTRGKDAVSDSGSLIKMQIIFKTKMFKIAELKLSEVRALLGATADYRSIEANTTQQYTGDTDVPAVVTSITQEKFIAWAKTYNQSQALQILDVL